MFNKNKIPNPASNGTENRDQKWNLLNNKLASIKILMKTKRSIINGSMTNHHLIQAAK